MRKFNTAFIVLAIFCGAIRADDWPQWLGPKRDGVWRESGLLAQFPKEGLKVVWRAPIGAGYAGPAVVGERVFVTDHQYKSAPPKSVWSRSVVPGTERVVCLDRTTGKTLWVHEYDCPYDISYGAGPRTTPAVDGERVYALGSEGDLLCLEVATGKKLWSHHMSTEKNPAPLWGFSGHPLVDGDKVIVLSCGDNPAGGHGLFTAFNKKTGEVIWTALSAAKPGYAPPMIFNVAGRRLLIAWCPDSVNGLDPETGAVIWTQPHGPIKNGVTIATPRFVSDANLGDLLYLSTANEGSLVMKLTSATPSVLWKRGGTTENKTDALHALMAAPTIRDGHVYGICIGGELRCLDLKTGDRLWATYAATTGDVGKLRWANAFLIPIGDAGSRFVLANESGDVILADLTPTGYTEISRAHLLNPTNTSAGRPVIWCHPAFANRCIFWRNDKEIICVSMAAE